MATASAKRRKQQPKAAGGGGKPAAGGGGPRMRSKWTSGAGGTLRMIGGVKNLAHVVIVIMCIRYWATRPAPMQRPESTWEAEAMRDARAVRSFPWPSSRENADVVAWLARDAVPTVLTGTPAGAWPAMSRWTPEVLERELGTLRGVSSSPNGYFQYVRGGGGARASAAADERLGLAAGHPNGTVPPAVADAADRSAAMPASEFFRAARNASGDEPHVYWSDRLDAAPRLDADAPGAAETFGVRWEGDAADGRQEPEVFLWMGSRGTTASPHYDAVHNFYVQVRGRKRFLLAPPARGLRLLAPHPRLHPSARNSQLYLRETCANASADAPSPRAFPQLNCMSRGDAFGSPLDARVVTLGPGDVLYLPPFWWHYVASVSDEASVSVSVWTTSREDLLSARAEDVPLPLEADWPASSLRSAGATFLRMVLDRAGADGLGPAVRLLRTRYARFLDAHALGAADARDRDASGAALGPPRARLEWLWALLRTRRGGVEALRGEALARGEARLLEAGEEERGALRGRVAQLTAALVPRCAGTTADEWAAAAASSALFSPAAHERFAARAAEAAAPLLRVAGDNGALGADPASAFAYSTRDTYLQDYLEQAARAILAASAGPGGEAAAPDGWTVPMFLLALVEACPGV